MRKTTITNETAILYRKLLNRFGGVKEMIKDFINDMKNDDGFVSYICRKIVFDEILLARQYPDYLEKFSSFSSCSVVYLDEEDLENIKKIDQFLKSEYLLNKYYGKVYCKGVVTIVIMYLYLKYFIPKLYNSLKEIYVNHIKPMRDILNTSV